MDARRRGDGCGGIRFTAPRGIVRPMLRGALRIVLAVIFFAAGARLSAQDRKDGAPATASLDQTLPILTGSGPATSAAMAKRHVIRALVVYSRMFYFIDHGTQRGAAYDALKFFERYVNERLHTGEVPVRVRLLSGAAGPDHSDVARRPGRSRRRGSDDHARSARARRLLRADPLRGQRDRRHRPGVAADRRRWTTSRARRCTSASPSSYLREPRAPQRDVREGGQRASVRIAPEDLQDEDLLEMLNAGLVRLVVVDDDIAGFWARSTRTSVCIPAWP